jgi:hypothetical protein
LLLSFFLPHRKAEAEAPDRDDAALPTPAQG